MSDQKAKIINASRFLAEGYRYNIMNVDFFSRIISTFLPKDSTETSEHNEFTLIQIESLGVIASIIGRSIDSSANANKQSNLVIQHAIEDGFQLIQNLSVNPNIRPQTRYMLKSLIELKNNRWVLPSQHQSQVEQESLHKEIVAFAEDMGKSINKFLSSHCANDDTSQIFWKTMLQSISTKNYMLFKETILEDRTTSPSSAPVVPLSPWLRRASAKMPLSPLGATSDPSANKHNIQRLNLSDLQQQQPMDIDNNEQQQFSLSGDSGEHKSLLPVLANKLILKNIESNLPSGFISPKAPRDPQDCSPVLPNGAELGAGPHRESPELSNAGGNSSGGNNSNLSVLLSIIESNIIEDSRAIWKSKIVNLFLEMKPTLKKNNKTEILAAVWQSMCDNQDEFATYVDLCCTLVKLDEPPKREEKQPKKSPRDSMNMQQPTGPGGNAHEMPNVVVKKMPNRRCSMITFNNSGNVPNTSVPANLFAEQPSNSMMMARRSSIAAPSELIRRGSMSDDSPNVCPPAPKLKATPTLSSVSHKQLANTKPAPLSLPPLTNLNNNNSNNNLNNNVPNVNKNKVNANSNFVDQPNAKKVKMSNSESFGEVLVNALQDDLALQMFIKKESLNVYFKLLEDLYKEFVIEIPLLLNCISLIQLRHYELSEEECLNLEALSKLAQDQQDIDKERESLLSNTNQYFAWKTNTWEEKPAPAQPPPSGFFDLTTDVFVL
ncbi:hypothetical protein SAMD00019534_081260 [Acytostelium subglobosum LB1]|uniref:hypothetical protein n=1 Tax=Acytostelium subglobosum LB1 TaxID=1410327 RepID=UPI000644DACB|nr:hypothetical protein SAMD00019534_081260 [Acytostelium subglobosum LB1]GAM24951.1 hypothetical protein SAMD00019534_081260 [Acytostelium subglobosum LB1]|eukprot:XP_012752040.1 hypothetical protein SAMD00019534_081260 [Acytostelium subglobosum LB1]